MKVLPILTAIFLIGAHGEQPYVPLETQVGMADVIVVGRLTKVQKQDIVVTAHRNRKKAQILNFDTGTIEAARYLKRMPTMTKDYKELVIAFPSRVPNAGFSEDGGPWIQEGDEGIWFVRWNGAFPNLFSSGSKPMAVKSEDAIQKILAKPQAAK